MDARGDLYSLGAVGYFLLTGTTVFSAATVVEVCSLHLHAQPEPPSRRTQQIPRERAGNGESPGTGGEGTLQVDLEARKFALQAFG